MPDLGGSAPGAAIKKKVDEAWKNSVDKEREVVESPSQRSSSPNGSESAFLGFLSSLALQALSALGESPDTGEIEPASADLAQAKYLIDILTMLSEKTRGNLNPQESAAFENLLYELQLKFVQRSKAS